MGTKVLICRSCGIVFGRFDKQYVSSVFGSDAIICESCSEYEEAEIDQTGNDIPELLARYNANPQEK